MVVLDYPVLCWNLLVAADGRLSAVYNADDLCLVGGGMIGAAFRIEERLEHLGKRWNKSLVVWVVILRGLSRPAWFIVGAMAVVGALEDGLTGKIEILLSKSILDGISAVIWC